MYTSISKKFTESIVANGIIEENDAELYFIGYQCGLTLITSVACVLITGAFMQILPESAIFIFSFYILRICANGFHLKSIDSCFWFSYAVEFAVLLGIKYLPFNMAAAITITVVIAVICSRFCPVPNENKEYTEREAKRFRKLSLLVLGIEFTVASVFSLVNITSFCYAILYGWVLYSLLNVMGHLQNLWRRRHPTSV